MDNKKIIIDVPFNVDFRNYFARNNQYDTSTQGIFNRHFDITQTKQWIDYRINIFMNYTGKSFMNQTNQNFTALIRYNEPTKALVFDALSKHPKLPDNIKFVNFDEANSIVDKAMEENDYLYHVNIDSDNMYAPDFIEIIDKYNYEEGVECLLCHDGYIYDTVSNRVAMISHYSPSLYVYVYNKRSYKQNFRARLFEAHGNAQLHENRPLAGRTYMLVTHESNLDNNFELIKNWLGNGTTLEGEEKTNVLKEWGIM